MRLWLQTARKNIAKKKKYKGNEGLISKSLSDLTMSGTAVAVDGPRFMNNMRSEKHDGIQYLSVDDLGRKKYWRSGEEREELRKTWKKQRTKLSVLFYSKETKF